MAQKPQRQSTPSTVDPAEVERFSALAAEWWNPRGKMAPLHKFNPVRLGYIRDQAALRFGRDAKRLDSLKGLRILDIGCGGGMLSEPLARLGAAMVGVDPSDTNIAAAKEHAAQSGLAIDYRCTTAEELAEAGEAFDIVLAMEVVEHVADVPLFVASCADDGEARRADDRRHAQPHAEELRARDRRRRIHPALAAGRQPSLGQVRHAERARDRDGAGRAAGDRRARA